MSGRLGLAMVRGRSMRPTLRDGDRLLVRYGTVPVAGRLVVVLLPNGVVAVKRAVRRSAAGWWVERDNPAEGVDSWTVGPIQEDRVLAVVLCRVWPIWWQPSRRREATRFLGPTRPGRR